MNINPLNELSADVRQALLDGGWKPGITRPRFKYSFEEHQMAKQVLDELEGIEVAPIKQTGPYRPLRVHFLPSVADGYEDEIRELGRRLNVVLSPLANVGNGVAILLLAETGDVLLLGYADKGVLLAGSSFGEAMKRTLAGEANRPLYFDDDPPPNVLERAI